MAKLQISSKHLAISRAQAQVVGAVAAASFISIFCLVAASSLWSQKNYQSRVIAAEQKADNQLKKNIQAESSLVGAYQGFVSASANVIGGSATGSGDNDGDNAKIVLDALPSQYDFPAVTASLEKLVKDRNLNMTSITGTDDEVAQSSNTASSTPQPVSMPFGFTIKDANYNSIQDFINALQRSIRPIQFDTLTLSGGANDMTLTATAHTYYQPAKDLKVTTEVVK